ncbi:hypothetical protein CDAR_473241 [Caerostris darwini]|uniref:Uncharacterized protein n=1 Tax=Caerostris darwini TaxID=1538125 RepID=A0AAV4PLU8_9ARAC|nr:hypothetical protein CDAR_473121 [Caerostris darwini]GIX97400.1 hypothetical protein CDAR_473241 [Caerostris darwini]
MIGVGSLSEEDIDCALQHRFVGGLAFRHGNLGESQMYCACYSYFCFIAARNCKRLHTRALTIAEMHHQKIVTRNSLFSIQKMFENAVKLGIINILENIVDAIHLGFK